jgi:1-acyl-sn-glycerol-3-phosphate acyltransferase
MQDLIIEKPYRFVPPTKCKFVLWLTCKFNLFHYWLRRAEGICEFEVINAEKITDSIRARHGIVLAGNHCRNADPMAIGEIAKAAECYIYSMASWHLFNQDWFMRWAIPQLGGFSINREGVDRTALEFAIHVLATAERPLVIFPEGSVSRSNDYLHPFLGGTGFIARTAARRRKKQDANLKVVIHPIAFRYQFIGDFEEATEHSLTLLESHLEVPVKADLPLLDRIGYVASGLLAQREKSYFGYAQAGEYYDRIMKLAQSILEMQEKKWKGEVQQGDFVARAKALRPLMVPDLANGLLGEEEAKERRQDLFDINTVQQLSYYPVDYIVPADGHLPRERILEMLERLEEDLLDKVTIPRRYKLVMEVLDAIEVPAEKAPRNEDDPLMQEVASALQSSLDVYSRAAESYVGNPAK